jgi:hypothetical protein
MSSLNWSTRHASTPSIAAARATEWWVREAPQSTTQRHRLALSVDWRIVQDNVVSFSFVLSRYYWVLPLFVHR